MSYINKYNNVMIKCCNLQTGAIKDIDADRMCTVYKDAMIRLGE